LIGDSVERAHVGRADVGAAGGVAADDAERELDALAGAEGGRIGGERHLAATGSAVAALATAGRDTAGARPCQARAGQDEGAEQQREQRGGFSGGRTGQGHQKVSNSLEWVKPARTAHLSTKGAMSRDDLCPKG